MDIEVLKTFLPQIIATAVALVLLPLLKYASRKLTRKYGTMLGKSDTRIRQIRTNDSELIVIPNNLFLQKIVGIKK